MRYRLIHWAFDGFGEGTCLASSGVLSGNDIHIQLPTTIPWLNQVNYVVELTNDGESFSLTPTAETVMLFEKRDITPGFWAQAARATIMKDLEAYGSIELTNGISLENADDPPSERGAPIYNIYCTPSDIEKEEKEEEKEEAKKSKEESS